MKAWSHVMLLRWHTVTCHMRHSRRSYLWFPWCYQYSLRTNMRACFGLIACMFLIRLVHQDGSLADLTMLSASSVEATSTRDEQEPQEEHREWGAERKEQPLLEFPAAEVIGEKTRIFSEQRQSSTDESFQCSAGTEPEPSTEPSSGNTHADVSNSSSASPQPIYCIHCLLIILIVAHSTMNFTKMLYVHFCSP